MRSCFKGNPAGTELTGWIGAVRIHAGRAACGINHIPTADDTVSILQACRTGVQTEKTADIALIPENGNHLCMIEKGNLFFFYAVFQHLGHFATCIRADAGRALSGVMIGFISDIFAISIAGERHPQLDKTEETLNRHQPLYELSLDGILEADRRARDEARDLIRTLGN